MKRAITVLSMVLAGQLALAGGLWLAGGQEQAPVGKLLEIAEERVTGLTISGPDGKSVELTRGDQGWTLPQADGFPADSDKVSRLVAALAGLEAGIPVTRSASAAERFGLGEEGFERRLEIRAGQGEPVTLLVGESAGAGRVYARRADSSAVHEVRFKTWLAKASEDHWYATSTPAVDPAEVTRVETPGFTLERTKDSWTLTKPQGLKGKVDDGEARRLVRDLARPSFHSVSKAQPPQGEASVYRITTKDGKKITYRYLSGDGDNGPVFVREGQPWVYRIKSEQLTRLTQLKPDSLLAETKAEQDQPADEDARS